MTHTIKFQTHSFGAQVGTWLVSTESFRVRAVTNVVRTCSPTPLL